MCSTLGWFKRLCRECLSNHMSDLTKSLWFISEKSTTLFANKEYSFNRYPTARKWLSCNCVVVIGEVEDKDRTDHAFNFFHFNNQKSTIITRQSSIHLP